MPRTRYLHLIRHGQYVRDPEELTALGRAQAARVGQRLAQMAMPNSPEKKGPMYPPDRDAVPEVTPVTVSIRKLTSSTMPRARETAGLLHTHLPAAQISASSLLNENLPGRPRDPAPSYWEIEADSRQRMEDRFQRMWKRFSKPPRASEQHDVVVAHGNVIRGFVATAMNVDIGVWHELACPAHCSLTTLRIRRGQTNLIRFNDAGHLPPEMLTLT